MTDIKRATGLLVIEVINSNPNGNPDFESEPRQRSDGFGEISPVSFKRKLRDLVEDKGLVWQELKKQLDLEKGKTEKYSILESKDVKREEVKKMIKKDVNEFKREFWDARVFGNTFLEKDADDKDQALRKSIKAGVVHFGLGLSLAPVDIERLTFTKKAPAQDDKQSGMAPMAYRVVKHGIYVMPFFVNPNAALPDSPRNTGCTKTDIDLLLKLIPYGYSHNPSLPRNQVSLIYAWCMEHSSPLGSCSDFKLIEAMTPKRKTGYDKNTPSLSRSEYDFPTDFPEKFEELPFKEKLKGKITLRNLIEEAGII